MRKLISLIIFSSTLFSFCHKTQEVNYFTVTWLNYDGTTLEVDENVIEGAVPSFDGTTPKKNSDEFYDYTFKSWDKELTEIHADTTFVALYESHKNETFIVSSHQSGFYNEPFLLELRTIPGYDIFYSLDNSDPNEHSTRYASPISISDASNKDNHYSLIDNISALDVYFPSSKVDKCTLIKAVAINKDTNEKSEIKYLNFFVGFENKAGYENVPVVTLNINDGDLFDYEKGIYVTGKIYDENPHEGYPETYPANYQQKGKEWEKPANFQYFESNKAFSFEQNIGVRIHGGWSRAFNQKSFNLYARKEYSGTSTFAKKFFSNINAHSLMLRSGGYRDTFLTKVRDSLNQDLSVEERFDVQRSLPVIVFLNGEYWGIYNLQERFSDNYVEEYHNIKKKNVLIIRNDEIDEGNESDYHYYEELISFFRNGDFALEDTYNEATNYIDVNEFASYMSTQLYVGNIDWPGNNVRAYKDISKSDSKWHFMMYDTDDSSDIVPSKCAVDVDPFLKSSHWKSGPLEDDCLLGLMLSQLIKNSTFKALFRNAFMRIGQNNFSSTRVTEYLNNKQQLLRTTMVNNYKRFVNESYDENYFDEKINVIKAFFNQRYSYASSYLDLHIPA